MALALLLMTATGVFVYQSASSAAALVRDSESAQQTQRDNLQLLVGMVNQETGIRGYAATGSPVFLEPYSNGKQQSNQALADLDRETRNSSLASLLPQVEETRSEWEAWAENRVHHVQQLPVPAIDPITEQQGKRLFDAFRAADDQLAKAAGDRAASTAAQAARRQAALPVALVVGGAAAGGVLLLLMLMLSTLVFRPLLALSRSAERLAEGKDAAVPGVDRRDEVGQLARALRSWQESEAMRRTMLREAPLGVLRMAEDGRILAANPAICSMLGYSEDELVRLDTSDVTAADYLALNRRLYAETAAGRRDRFVLEKRYVRKDGSTFWGALTVSPVRDEAGGFLYFIAMVEDISVRKEKAARAAEIQRDLLPHRAPGVPGYQLAAACLPAEDVGGDFFDWYRSGPGELTFSLGDVMGKGMPAAILMATVRAALRAGAGIESLEQITRLASTSIRLEESRGSFFVTLLHARLEDASGRLRYVDAGHGLVLVVEADGRVTRLGERGLPLCVFEDQSYPEGVVTLAPGAALVAFSDGLLDVHPELEKDLTSLSSLIDGAGSAQEIADRLLPAPGWGPAEDDVTVLVVRREPVTVERTQPVATATATSRSYAAMNRTAEDETR